MKFVNILKLILLEYLSVEDLVDAIGNNRNYAIREFL